MNAASNPPDSWVNRIVSGITGDVVYATRRLRKDRVFTAIALLTLALCIGANTAIFSVVYAFILKPLPFPSPTRIVEINNNFPKAGLNGFPSNLTQYADFKANTAAFDSIGLLSLDMDMVGEAGSAERILGANATAEMFDVLGIKPLIGSFFTLTNCRAGEDKVVVLTEGYWKSHYNEDPGVLDKTMRINEATYRIIGVAPESFAAFTAQARYIKPIAWKPGSINPDARYGCMQPLFARLKAGSTQSQGFAEVDGLERHYYAAAVPQIKAFLDQTGHKISLTPVQTHRVQPFKSSLIMLQGGVVFVLLIGCVNIANLLLTRANGQQSELAVRAALGAGRGAIARQLLVESLVLTAAGALAGIALAIGAVDVINHFTAKLFPNRLPIEIDGSVLCYAVAISLAVGLLIGLLPVVHILRSNLAEVIHRSSRATSGGRGVRALSSILVTGQVAVALILLSGAGLLIHSFANAISVAPGFDPSNLAVGSIALPAVYQDQAKASALQNDLVRGLKEIPGIEDAALATGVPFGGNLPILALTLKESTLPRDAPQPGAFLIGVSLGYFKTLHVQLLEGRFLDETDLVKGRTAYVVDELFAKRYFPGRSAVGAHFTVGNIPDKDSDWPVIVGVVRFIPHNGIEDRSNNPYVYYPLLTTTVGGMNFLVRTSRPLGDTLSTIREKLKTIDPAIPLFETGTAQKTIDESLDNRRAVMFLLGGFAGLALFLSSIGIYGVLAYDISQRTREIGIRGAIGATRSQITGMVLRQGLWKTGIGIVVGLVCALLLSHYMVSMLYSLKPTDPWAYAAVSLILAAVAAAASYLPARRAARIDPILALRSD